MNVECRMLFHKTKSTENRLQDPIQCYNIIANQLEHVDRNRTEN